MGGVEAQVRVPDSASVSAPADGQDGGNDESGGGMDVYADVSGGAERAVGDQLGSLRRGTKKSMW